MLRRIVCFSLGLVLSGASIRAADISNADLAAQIQAMRQAYESRIATLETQLKAVQTARSTEQREVNIDRGVNRALGQPPVVQKVYDEKATDNGSALPANMSVRSTSAMTLGGYSEFNYTDRASTKKEFDSARTVLQVGAQMHDRLKFYMELEYEHGAHIEGGEATGGEWELEQAYLDFSFHEKINFRAGNLLVPVGHYNLYHEGFLNNHVERPLVDQWIIPSTFYEEGIQIYGQALDTKALGISYEAGMYNPGRALEVNSDEGFRHIRNEGSSPEVAYGARKAGAARVAFEPARSNKKFADHFELGLSGYVSGYQGPRTPDHSAIVHDGGTLGLMAVDFTYEKAGFGLRGEAAHSHVGRTGREALVKEIPDGVPDDEGNLPTREVLKDQDGWGYYVEGFYKFWPKFLGKSTFGRDFKDPKLVLSLRYDYINLDKLADRQMDRVTLGFTYRPTPRTAFKVDYQFNHCPNGTWPVDQAEAQGLGKNSNALLFGIHVGF